MKIYVALALCGALSACSNGTTAPVATGGGGQQATATLTPYSARGANEQFSLTGSTASGAYTSNASGNLASFVGTGARTSSSDTVDVQLVNNALKAFSVNAGAGSVAYDEANGDTAKSGSLNNLLFFSSRNNGRSHLFAQDPNVTGFEYQIAATWHTGLNSGNGQAGVGSFGSATPDGAAVVNGVAEYSGNYVGMRGSIGGNPLLTEGTTTLFVNFKNGGFDLYTNETSNVDFHGSAMPSTVFANFNGTINGSSLTGTPRTGTGSMNGSFYGPNGEEVGGTFNVTDGSTTSLGAFGAKRTNIIP